MDAEKKKIAADCWKKGSEAMSKENWDYAIEMFGKAVTLVPELAKQALVVIRHGDGRAKRGGAVPRR